MTPESKRDPRLLAMGASLGLSVLMLVGKMAAYFLTGSAAIFSDALESVVHIFATAFVGFSLWYAMQPPDARHPYGHGKIAYLSSGFEGGLILVAAVSILYSAILSLVRGPQLQQLGLGLLITAGLAAVNLVLGLALIRVGKRYHSLVLISNGKHVLTDMWTSLGVVVGVTLVWMTDLLWLDPIVAIIMAFNILWTAFQLIRGSFVGLMERVEAADTRVILEELEKAQRTGLISSYHQVRHRQVNDQVWLEYHLQFPEDLRITEAHARSHDVEEAITARLPQEQVYVTAHLEPDAHDEAHPDGHREPVDPFG